MAEYIEREALIDIFNAKADMATGTPKECFFAAVKMVGLLPAADVVEVRHGEWAEMEIGEGFYCVDCGECANYPHNYCPWCGAKMDGKGEGE